MEGKNDKTPSHTLKQQTMKYAEKTRENNAYRAKFTFDPKNWYFVWGAVTSLIRA